MAVISFVILIFASGKIASGYTGVEDEYRFSRTELVQMLAPIALYPDSLLSQVLMASTYPLEIVEAERWLRKNSRLEGDDLRRALLEKDWDTSVKSLCHFKDVLFALSEKLEQTRNLGDAFLSQEEEVMAVVQELRRMAYENGTLKKTGEQKVIVEREIIRIEPYVSHMVYVPIYDPLYAYGTWRYPAYPPYYWYYPSRPNYRVRYIYFGSPVYIGIDWFAWTWFDWPSLRIYIVWDNASRYHRHPVHRPHDYPYWQHDPHHRRGVVYMDRNTRERFEYRPSRISPERSERLTAPTREKPERPHTTAEPRENPDYTGTRPERVETQPGHSREFSRETNRETRPSTGRESTNPGQERQERDRRQDTPSTDYPASSEREKPSVSPTDTHERISPGQNRERGREENSPSRNSSPGIAREAEPSVSPTNTYERITPRENRGEKEKRQAAPELNFSVTEIVEKVLERTTTGRQDDRGRKDDEKISRKGKQ